MQLEVQGKKLQANTCLAERESTINTELEQLGIKLNSTLEKLLVSTPEGIVETAIRHFSRLKKLVALKTLEFFCTKQLLTAGNQMKR